MNTSERGLGLADALEAALRSGGPRILSNPRVLLGVLADTMDPDSKELRVFERCMDEEMLAPFAHVETMGKADIQGAASRMQAYLVNECMVDQSVAASIAGGFVVGVARWRGLVPAHGAVAPDGRGRGFSGPERPVATLYGPPPTGRRGVVVQPAQVAGRQGSAGQPAQVVGWQGQGVAGQVAGQGGQVAGQFRAGQDAGQTGQGRGLETPVAPMYGPPPIRRGKPWLPIAIAAVVLVALVLVRPWRLLGGGSSQGEGIWLTKSSTTTDASGKVTSSYTYERDRHGNTTAFVSRGTFEDGDTYTSKYAYDGCDRYGRVATAKAKTVFGDGYTSRSTTTYSYETDADGLLLGSKETYVSKSRSGDEDEWSSSYRMSTETTYAYEGKTLVGEESATYEEDGEGRLQYETQRSYDENGRITHERSVYHSSYSGDSVAETTWEYEFYGDGDVRWSKNVTTETDDEGTKTSSWEYEYDERGGMTRRVETDEDGKVTTFTYELTYDAHDNVLRSENLTDGSVTTYEYEYCADPSPRVAGDLPR